MRKKEETEMIRWIDSAQKRIDRFRWGKKKELGERKVVLLLIIKCTDMQSQHQHLY